MIHCLNRARCIWRVLGAAPSTTNAQRALYVQATQNRKQVRESHWINSSTPNPVKIVPNSRTVFVNAEATFWEPFREAVTHVDF